MSIGPCAHVLYRRDVAEIEFAVEMRKRLTAARNFPAQRLAQPIGIDRDQEQPGLAREVFAGRAFELGSGRKMDEAVAHVVVAAAKYAMPLGLSPCRSRTDFVDRAHAFVGPAACLVARGATYARAVRESAGVVRGFEAQHVVERRVVATHAAVRERLPRQVPADGAVAQRADRIRHPGIDERLRPDDAARAARAVDDDVRGGIARDLPRALFRRRWVRFIASLIAERRAMGTDPANPRDLFDLMVAARDPETGEGFSDENLGDQVATMILAGHETTATALFWSLYLLALDPETQSRVASEARTVAPGGEPDFSRLAFTRAVIDETMRLYPPAFIIARAAKGSDIIDGRSVRKGDVVIISPWLLHRHKKLWREPDVFMPARFMPGAPPPDKFAYLPFGVGPRVCIGAHFALTEAVLALSRIVGTFNIALLSTRPAIPVGVVTTQPDHSPEFRIDRR